ncbi:subtilase family protease [Hoeflea sp. IMCC20628]|uniref:S8 family peptidase n=1 Tax=Hoeflea sp. IMCC20628 TaxID=1620421 RepID=UPI00063BDA0B|nr:S8/S53 family peptidase [Hoeflea sp. IMCC20628]AKI02709.1 subtilase family protease [Hoeflea sp. IMCC20628]
MPGMVSPFDRQYRIAPDRRRTAVFSRMTVLAGLICAASASASAGAVAQETGGRMIAPDFADASRQAFWRTEVVSKDAVQAALAKLYLTLSENTALKTKRAIILAGENPTDVMIRSGIWPSWLEGRTPYNVEVLLCTLNPDICSVRGKASKQDGVDWSKAWPGATIYLPDIDMRLSYEVGTRQASELASQVNDIAIVKTSDLAQLWCRKAFAIHESCAGSDVQQGWANRPPEIIQYVDDGKVDPEMFSKLASPNALRKFGAAGSEVKMVAIPIIEANFTIESFDSGAYGRAFDSLSENVIVEQKLRLQSASFKQNNQAKLRWMEIVNKAGQMRTPWKDGENLKPVTIAHIDGEADLNHCAFKGKVHLMRWNLEKRILEEIKPLEPAPETAGTLDPDNGAEAVNASLTTGTETVAEGEAPDDTAGADCGLLNEHPLAEKSHGTHTLGMLVELLSLGGQTQAPPGGLPPVTIIHVPNPDGAMSPNEPAMKALLEAVNLFSWWDVDAVNMSVAWNKAEAGLLEKAIIQDAKSIPFIVAAGNYNERAGCSISPACIESRNVISVVGLDVDADGRLKLLDQSNAGYRYHDIGAIGSNLISTVGDGMVGPLSGTSQAAPIVAAVVGHLIRRGMRDVDDIYTQLITTAKLDDTLLDYANATMIDMDRVMQFGVDHVELSDGCRMDGTFTDLTNASQLQANWTVGEGGLVFIDKDALRRFHYNARLDWHLIMYEKNNRLHRGTFQVVPEHLDRIARFLPATVSEECGERKPEFLQKFPMSEIADLIVTTR